MNEPELDQLSASADADKSPADPPLRDKPPAAKKSGRGGKRAGAGRPKGSTSKPSRGPTRKQENDALQAALGELLAMPLLVTAMLPIDSEGKAFMQQHFIGAAPSTAAQLVALSEHSPELRGALTRATTGSVTLGLIMLGVGYAAPPALWMLGQRGPALALNALATMTPEQVNEMAVERQAMLDSDATPTPQPETAAAGYAAEAVAAARQAQAAPGADPFAG